MFEWTIEHLAEENILYLKSKGIMTVPDANAMVKAIADAAIQYQCLVHLVDHRETTFNFHIIDSYDRPAITKNLAFRESFILLWFFGS